MVKQVIIIRKDLKMRRGKEIAQGSHASMKFLCDRIRNQSENAPIELSDVEWAWINGLFTKICLQVPGETELLDVCRRASEFGLTCSLIQDAGITEFGGTPTYTCCAVGPDAAEKIDQVTGNLPLY